MRGSGIDELPYPIVYPLQRWFDRLGLPNTTFFRAELVVNYELRSRDERPFKGIRNQSKSLVEAINAIHWPVLRVTVPSKAFGPIPHFAIVAHEIGHALCGKIKWDLSAFVAKEEANLIRRICQKLGGSNLNKQATKTLQDAFFNWFQELAADAFSLYLTGPASFFALSEFFELLGGSYGLCFTHPSHELRRKILFDKLKEGGGDTFAGVFAKHTGQPLTEDFNSPFLIRTPNKSQIYQDMLTAYDDDVEKAAVLTELHESMPAVVNLIYDQVRQFMLKEAPEAIYTAKMYDSDLGIHLNAILAAIPPIETGEQLGKKEPTSFATIINVGWVALLTKLSDLRVKTAADDKFGAEKLERLHALLLKAVELSEARSTWESA